MAENPIAPSAPAGHAPVRSRRARAPVVDTPLGSGSVPAEPEYTATGLPAGLSISADGVISGAVTSLGTHTVTITGPARDPRSVTFDWIVL